MEDEDYLYTPYDIAEGLIRGNLVLSTTVENAKTDSHTLNQMCISIMTLLLDDKMCFELLLPSMQRDGSLVVDERKIDELVTGVVKALFALCTQ
jgi:hypothetical protein